MTEQGGWRVGEAIALELDVVLGLLPAEPWAARLSPDTLELAQSLPPDWMAHWSTFLGTPRTNLAFLETIASLAGVTWEADYSAATLAMRDLSLQDALDRLRVRAEPYEIAPDAALPPVEQAQALHIALTLAQYGALGFRRVVHEVVARRWALEMGQVAQVLRDGPLHSRFWHWLDRFYFGFYAPWRERFAPVLAAQRVRAVAALGALEGTEPPAIEWLPIQNPVRLTPLLREAVAQRSLSVFFWVEPFGMYDSWFLEPHTVGTGFAEPGAIYERFRHLTTDLATRLHALSDPTRLAILRLIRTFSLDNTMMADYLEIARPTVSIHAKVLREAGLIRTHHEGRQAQHEVIPTAIWQLLHDLEVFLDLPEGDTD